MYQYLKRALRRPFKGMNDDGGVTVEFVVLFPALLVLTGAAIDFGFTYFKQSQVHAAVQDITRARSIGSIATNGEAETILADRLALGFTDEAVVSVDLIGAMVSTSVRVPLHDMQLVGYFSALIGDPMIEIGDQQFLESFDIAVSDEIIDDGQDTSMVDGILEEGTGLLDGTVDDTPSGL